MQPDIDYIKIGQRIRAARLSKNLTQADLGEMIGCSNNHMSHMEIGQTKVSLTMLLKLSLALDESLDYFLLDTPYARRESIINQEISKKLDNCSSSTLIAVNKIIDILLEQQHSFEK